MGDCAGSEPAALFGCGLLFSYLILFISFYRKTYKRVPGKTAKKAKVAAIDSTLDVRGTSQSKVEHSLSCPAAGL